MTVTRDGVPVRCWTFVSNEGDQRIIRTVKEDLGSWNLRRLVWVDRGFASAANLPVKEVTVAPDGHGDGDGDEGARAVRFVICHNPDQAERDVAVRAILTDVNEHVV